MQYKKWILIAALVWCGLLGTFWSTAYYGYAGFLTSIIILMIVTGVIWYLKKNTGKKRQSGME